jgi:polysaccharide deacetylase family protein (PEP-CTERM system associated)
LREFGPRFEARPAEIVELETMLVKWSSMVASEEKSERNNHKIVNALTVDVEEHYHAAALSAALPRSSWTECESRVGENTRRILDLLAAHRVRATFFILGAVARRDPRLIRAIAAGEHEIASHGADHYRVGEQSTPQFAEDVTATRKLLEDVSGTSVIGYRAANFSIDCNSWWAYSILEQAGYRYSSSINPIVHDHYGVPEAPRFPFRPREGDLIEIPVTTLQAGRLRVPAGGGGYFRLLPYVCYQWALRHLQASDEKPAIFYFHPWEIDPNQPRADVRGLARFRHYVNLRKMEGKLARLLADFRWARMDEIFDPGRCSGLPLWRPHNARVEFEATST